MTCLPKVTYPVIVVCLALSACAGPPVQTDTATVTDLPSAGAESGRTGKLYFAGQPDEADLQSYKQSGVDRVINLRAPAELDWDEAAAASKAGLGYHQVPVSREGVAFDMQSMEQISALVRRYPDDDIVVHCGTGQRASAWYATYLVQYLGMDVDVALDKARATGLSSNALEDRVRVYVGQPPTM